MRNILVFGVMLCLGFTLSAQNLNLPIHVGYFAPYGTHIGLKVGTSLGGKDWKSNTQNEINRLHTIKINPQVGYFMQLNVQKNILFNVEFEYRTHSSNRSFYPLVSVGMGYLAGFQRQDGTVNLGTGEIDHNIKTIHHFVPTINLGFGRTPQQKFGYYFKLFYGSKISTVYAAFFGAELGVIFHIIKK